MKYLLVINYFPKSILKSVQNLQSEPKFKDLAIAILTKSPDKYIKYSHDFDYVKVLPCSFGTAEEIKKAMQPVAKRIIGVVCRQDKEIQYLRKVLKFLPGNVPVASGNALKAATNKRLMRELFIKKYPEISPAYVKVTGPDTAQFKNAESKLEFPVILKPANLASSLLIRRCNTPKELQESLVEIYKQINNVYEREDRSDPVEVIVEEYLEGDFYSIDPYVTKPGKVFYCPVTGYVPYEKIGVDDFSLYKRYAPSGLSKKKEQAAQETTRKAIDALSLTYSSAHVEMVLTKNGWKVIEAGPRLGRFRHAMYEHGYGIDHAMNDVRIHLGLDPVIKNDLLKYCSAYSIYPKKEGRLVKLHGLEELKQKSGIYKLKIHAAAGDDCKYAKNGGKALLEFIVAHSNKKYYNKVINFVERQVWAETR